MIAEFPLFCRFRKEALFIWIDTGGERAYLAERVYQAANERYIPLRLID